jgi:predicted PhzF superfamily epimerase YddE/YHI9
MKISLYQVDAFASTVFKGNPAAVCPLTEWLDDRTLQSIALENNLSETAFFVPKQDGFHLRWFTPTSEVDLCGHATLAAAYVLIEILKIPQQRLNFNSASGPLSVFKKDGHYTLDFPIRPGELIDCPQILVEGLGKTPLETYLATDCLVVLGSQDEVLAVKPDFQKLLEFKVRGILITAPGENCDFVSRCFYPSVGVPEDPVTGSAHCTLVPYWAKRLEKNSLYCRQISSRGGELWCALNGARVEIAGNCALYLTGTIEI